MNTQHPLKRHPAIVSFSKDHHFGLLLVWKIRQGLSKAVDPERISNYVLFSYQEDLAKHFADEESLLLVHLNNTDLLRRRAEAEHHTIVELVNAIEHAKNDIGLLTRFADALEQHIRFEERVLFNHLQDNIDNDDLEQIAHRIANNSREIDEQWKDMFWVNSPNV